MRSWDRLARSRAKFAVGVIRSRFSEAGDACGPGMDVRGRQTRYWNDGSARRLPSRSCGRPVRRAQVDGALLGAQRDFGAQHLGRADQAVVLQRSDELANNRLAARHQDGARWSRCSGHGYERSASRVKELAELDLDLWTEDAGPNVAVDRGGGIVLDVRDHPQHADGQQLLDAEQFQLLRPFEISRETRGPDLVAPRPRLRIIPGKLSGAPHVHRTRIETEALAALARRGLKSDRIVVLYPAIEEADVRDALDLERQLQPDLAFAA